MTGPNITPDLKPDLLESSLPWYRGLTRAQWWVLLIASMGWMFDTMDQQFFNLGRGPAMMDVLGVAPLTHGREKLGPDVKSRYTVSELDALITAGKLTQAQKEQALKGGGAKIRTMASGNDVAIAIGEDLLANKYIELAEQEKLKGHPGESFDRAALERLVAANVMSSSMVNKHFDGYSDGAIPRQVLARRLGKEVAQAKADKAGDDATFIFVMGWAIGGLFFGWVGDSLGRAKTMAITILTYAVFTGLNGLAQNEWQFNLLRFLTALGVGGEFAAGAALVAETMPDRSRAAALGTLQALSALGNMTAAALAFFIMPIFGWRWLFAVGALPGIVAIFVFLRLKEPEKWREARSKWLHERAAGITDKRASYVGLLSDSRWRKRAIVGLLLGVVGVGGLWGVGFFTPELNRLIATKYQYAQEDKERFVSIAFFLQQAGAFLGISAYTVISLKMGRKLGFAVFFVLAFFVVSYTFLFADTVVEAYILAPLIGFVTLGPFGGYAIYFPELFPTRLRATGVGFCYNVGRFLSALVPSIKARLKELFMTGTLVLPFLMSAAGNAEYAIRYGSFVMIFIYIFGLFVLLFAPETKGQPLPED